MNDNDHGIAFTARLMEADWDETFRAWRCPALNLPGAVVEDIIVDGVRVDKALYAILMPHTMIRWIPQNPPQRIAAIIRITETLSLGSETDKWKRLAIVLPVVATIASAIISGFATYLSREPLRHSSTSAGSSVSAPAEANRGGSDARISSRTEFRIAMPRGNSVVVTWDEEPRDTPGGDILLKAGISLVDVDEGTKMAYAALTRRSKDEIEYVPLYLNTRPAPGYSQSIVRAGPAKGAGYQEFQLFQTEREFIIFFHPISSGPPIPPDKIGVDWDRVRAGLRKALESLYKGTKGFEFGGVGVLIDPDRSWEYRLSFHTIEQSKSS